MVLDTVNYQLEWEKETGRLCQNGARPPLLLHACCAPCASYVLEYLSAQFAVTVFFCNPNITDPAEYQKRWEELVRLCALAPFGREVTLVADDYRPQDFLAAAYGLEQAPEGGDRCGRCFRLRLSRTAAYAAAHGFDYFATTLTVSPHKNAARINEIGAAVAAETGVGYLASDFKKRGGYQRSIVLSREYGLYRQNYCGCVFSKEAAQQRPAAEK